MSENIQDLEFARVYNNIPSAMEVIFGSSQIDDKVRVITCNNCLSCFSNNTTNELYCSMMGMMVTGNDYCSFAIDKRKL